MTDAGLSASDSQQKRALLEERLAVAEETLRALRGGDAQAILMGNGSGSQRVYTLDTEDRPYRRLVERMSEGAALIDSDGLVVYANRRLATLVGVPMEHLIGQAFSTWLDEVEIPGFIRRLATGAPEGHHERALLRPDGARLPVLLGISPAQGPDERLHCLTVIDLTDQKRAQEQVEHLNAELTDRVAELRRVNTNLHDAERLLTHQTLHDPLTGLPNRTLFLNHLEQSLWAAARSGLPSAVCFIDVDDFKRINDSLGHEAGDLVLKEIAARLSSVVRPSDIVARFAGDEFLVLAGGTSGGLPAALGLADRLLAALLRPPLGTGTATGPETVTASIGIALSRPGQEPDELLHDADKAMYRAKRAGGARWELFDAVLREEDRRRLATREGLLGDLRGDGVRVYYQPVVDLTNGEQVGAEALVRLRRRNGRLRSPATFLPAAEESGLIQTIGRQVLEHACRQPSGWESLTGHPWFVSVNMSPLQLAGLDLVSEVEAALAAAALPSDHLHLELPESAMSAIDQRAGDTIEGLHDLGVQLGVDDFGTGREALSYLWQTPIDFIKLDRSLVAGMRDPHKLAMIEASLAISHRLGMRSVAKGVETHDQWTALRDLGCDEGQGFYFAPLPVSLR